MNVAPVLEVTADILARNMVLTSQSQVKLDCLVDTCDTTQAIYVGFLCETPEGLCVSEKGPRASFDIVVRSKCAKLQIWVAYSG